MIVMAHVSDIHIGARAANTERAARVMAYLNDLPQPVDLILMTGDIADHGLPSEYEIARDLLACREPVLTCPGNHDERGSYRRVLLGEGTGTEDGDKASMAPINRVHHVAGAVFALCDSSIPGRDDGYLDDATLTWLADVLASTPTDTPVFVCFHHPPVILHSPFIDAIRQRGEQRLAALVEDHPHVVALLCGHAHTAAAAMFAERPLLVAPGVASTLTFPWEHGDDLNLDVPPAIAFHMLDDEGRLTTHFRLVV